MKHEIRIQTSITVDEHIVQEVFDSEWRKDPTRLILRQVIDTKEAQIREALVRLGWTPPNSLIGGDSPPHR